MQIDQLGPRAEKKRGGLQFFRMGTGYCPLFHLEAEEVSFFGDATGENLIKFISRLNQIYSKT